MPKGLIYNIKDIEQKAGITFAEKYRDLQSCQKVGEFFGKFAGVYALSKSFIRYTLKKQGVKLVGKGGNHTGINWLEIEKQAGETINEMYKRLKSCAKVGQSLNIYVGNITGISGNCVLNELKRRGELIRSRGGRNNPNGRRQVNKDPIE